MEYSATQVGHKSFRQYLVLGDDLAIFDKEVYLQVIKNLAHIGVDVSRIKCTEGTNQAEIAKRLFISGEEVSPIPLALLVRIKSSPSLVIDFLMHIQQRGKKFSLDVLLDLSFSNNVEKI